MFEVPNWLRAIGIESNAELAILIAATSFTLGFAALLLYWRNSAREIRCAGESFDEHDPEYCRRMRWRNLSGWATLVSICVAFWTMHPMCIIAPAVLGGSLMLDIWQVPHAYVWLRKDR